MNVQEFQAKPLLSRYGITVPLGHVATTPAEAAAVARRLGCSRYAVKAQVVGKDREAAGGIQFAASPDAAAEVARGLLGRRLSVTGNAAGALVQQVYIEEAVDGVQELYAAATVDRTTGQIVLLASASGGRDIEARVAGDPGLIERLPLHLQDTAPAGDYGAFAARVGGPLGAADPLTAFLRNLARALSALDSTLIEINPVGLTQDGRLIALDAKMTIDDNALYRRPELAALREAGEGAPVELDAQRHQINYVALDGNIGVAVNGAGLALATQDLIVDAGGRPANFMDVRTTATSLDIAHGFGLLLANPRVKVMLVNVHGGGMQRCDTIAEGLGIALRRAGRALPTVIRMAGNNADFARTVLANNGVRYIAADTMAEAAARAASLARQEAA